MEGLSNLFQGFSVALQPGNLLWAFAGVLLGTVVGVLPGIGPALTVALLLPVTYQLQPVSAFIMFGGIKPTHILEWYNAITGRGPSLDEFLEIGARIFTQKRLFNIAAGHGGQDDTIPKRMLELPRDIVEERRRRGRGGAARRV